MYSVSIRIIGSILIAGMAITAAAAQLPSVPQLNRVIGDSKILDAASPFTATISGSTVILSTYKDKKTYSDKNCKIDGVLLTKVIIDAYPDVQTVRVCYFDRMNRNSYRYVDVQKAIVETFGKGKLKDDILLESMNIISAQTGVAGSGSKSQSSLDSYEPIQGIDRNERVITLAQIRRLRDAGAPVDGFFKEFLYIEREFIAKHDVDRSTAALNKLNEDLNSAVVRQNALLKADPLGPKQGPYYSRRYQVYQQLDVLSRKGVDVSEMKQLFREAVEDQVGRPNTDAKIDQTLTIIENRLRFIR